jgi:tetratricopeptide (TPR) repeat protein
MRRLLIGTFLLAAALALSPSARADNEGQADLDKATELQLTAETLGELEQVIKLAETALDKGLDKGQTEFAKKLLGATLFQHANRHAASVFEQSPPDPRWDTIRRQALKDLEKAKKYDPELPDIYILEAKFQALPRGDKAVADAALATAIKLYKAKDEPKELAKAYILRAQLEDDDEKKLADFEAALQADPMSNEARQGRALMYLQKGDDEKAVAELLKLVEQDADNAGLLAVLAEALTNLKKFDEALKYCEGVIKHAPRSTLGYNLRARIKAMKEDFKGAIEDLNQALTINGNDVAALLMRSRLNSAEGNDQQARADVEKALRIRPNMEEAIVTRSILAAKNERWGDAIADMQLLLQTEPTNNHYRLRLAQYLSGDKRPRKAIELLTSIIDSISADADKDDREVRGEAIGARGNALLSIGKHAEAVKDFEEVLKLDPEDTNVLNNYAWVLATSPDDAVRNADRSIELGTKACDLTKYEKPHILSTLASGYAEKGDFETAKKWSSKAVELGSKDEMIDEQLKKELESYKDKKPWREKQETEENTKPLGKSKSGLET